MFKRGLCLLFVFLLSFCLCFGYLTMCSGVEASAVQTYSKWSVSETSAFFGTSIPCTYEVGGVVVSGSFEYAGTYGNDWISACNIESNSVLSTAAAGSYDILAYRLTNYNYAGSNVGRVSIPVDIYVTGGFRTFWGICSSLETSGSPNPVFSLNSISDYPENFVSGGSAALPSASSPAYYNASTIRFAYQSNSYYGCTMRALTYDEIDGTISQLNFDGSRFFGTGQLWLFVATPYTYGDISHDSPTTTAPPVTTAPSGTGDINVNVDVDLTETNGLLDSILAALRGLADSILDGLKGLFIPDDDFMDQFKIDMEDLAQEHLGGLYQAEQLLVDMFEDFDQVTAKNEIYIPAAHIPLAGADLVLGDWHVPLKVTGLPAILYDGIAFIIDFLALMAFLAMCRRKLEIFLVPESEAIKE